MTAVSLSRQSCMLNWVNDNKLYKLNPNFRFIKIKGYICILICEYSFFAFDGKAFCFLTNHKIFDR